jgi:hypothetical protein
VRYCSVDCQRAAFYDPSAAHKSVCRHLRPLAYIRERLNELCNTRGNLKFQEAVSIAKTLLPRQVYERILSYDDYIRTSHLRIVGMW